MVKIGLQLKANLENVTNLSAFGDDFRWYLKFRCANCGEQSDKWQYLTAEETCPMKASRGEANLVSKCKLCSRENTVSIIRDSLAKYTIDDSNQYKTIIAFDCRGVEPIDFSPRSGFIAEGVGSNTRFDSVDLTENEWVEYDERAKQSVGVYDLSHKFIKM